VRPDQWLKLTCHSSLLPTCVTLWGRNLAVPAARSACGTQLSRSAGESDLRTRELRDERDILS
jgi:hypothetical protein